MGVFGTAAADVVPHVPPQLQQHMTSHCPAGALTQGSSVAAALASVVQILADTQSLPVAGYQVHCALGSVVK